MKRRCNQCYKLKDRDEGFRLYGRSYKTCNDCRALPPSGRRVESYRTGLRKNGDIRIKFIEASKNRKLGNIPVTMTTAETCPPSCGFYDNGCYGEFGLQRHHWRQAVGGLTWEQFLERVAKLPHEQIWRHNAVGDLPGEGEHLDLDRLYKLAFAAVHTRAFTFTHKGKDNLEGLQACAWGISINLSADSIEEADDLRYQIDEFDFDLGVAVTLPHNETRTHFRTPKGNQVTVCPVAHHKTKQGAPITCETCRLCINTNRKTIVGFPAHGNLRKLITLRLNGARP